MLTRGICLLVLFIFMANGEASQPDNLLGHSDNGKRLNSKSAKTISRGLAQNRPGRRRQGQGPSAVSTPSMTILGPHAQEVTFSRNLGTWRLFEGKYWQKVAPGGLALSELPSSPATVPAGEFCPTGMDLVKGTPLGSWVEGQQERFCTRLGTGEENTRCYSYHRQNYERAIARGRAGVNAQQPAVHFCMDRYEYPNIQGQYPLVDVSWYEAESLCQRQSKRLCTPEEWTYACEGDEAWPYPYEGWELRRNEIAGGCVFNRSAGGFRALAADCADLTNELSADVRNRYERHFRLDVRSIVPFELKNLLGAYPQSDPRHGKVLACLWKGEPSGTAASCRSAKGIMDMAGNVDEWTASGAARRAIDGASAGAVPGNQPTPLSPQALAQLIPAQSNPPHQSILKGGDWRAPRTRCRPSTDAHNESFKYYQIGFRCCR